MLTRLFNVLRRRLGLELGRVVSRPLGAEAPAGSPPGIRFVIVSEAQILPACADPALDLDADKVRSALRRGEVCVGAFDRDRLIGYQWYAFRAAPHLPDVWVRLGPGRRYSYKKFVHPDYRGQRIALGLSHAADHACIERGARESIGFIHLENTASWRASSRAGNRVAGYAGFWRLGRWFVSFASPGARRAGFGFHRRAKAAKPRFIQPLPTSS